MWDVLRVHHFTMAQPYETVPNGYQLTFWPVVRKNPIGDENSRRLIPTSGLAGVILTAPAASISRPVTESALLTGILFSQRTLDRCYRSVGPVVNYHFSDSLPLGRH